MATRASQPKSHALAAVVPITPRLQESLPKRTSVAEANVVPSACQARCVNGSPTSPNGCCGHVRRYEAPLTSTIAPVADSLPGEARKTITRATSSGVAARFIGL